MVKLGIKLDASEFTDSSVRCTLRSFLKIEYLGEIETEFENTYACLSGAWMGLNQEKSRGQKSRDTLALKEECQEIFDPFLLYSA